MPAGCPHRVENLTDTLALSCNYVDATNVDASLTALGHQVKEAVRAFRMVSDVCTHGVQITIWSTDYDLDRLDLL